MASSNSANNNNKVPVAEVKALTTAWDVDRRIVLDSADRLVAIRFSGFAAAATEDDDGVDEDPTGESINRSSKRARLETPNTTTTTARSSSSGGAGVLSSASRHHADTLLMDDLLRRLAPKVRKYCVIYTVDTNKVSEFNDMYELGHDRDPFALMFFYRNEHIRVDVGTGNHNKVNFYHFEGIEDILPVIDAAYRAGKYGSTMTTSAKKFTTASVQR